MIDLALAGTGFALLLAAATRSSLLPGTLNRESNTATEFPVALA
jgi:hypothetical protein